MIEERIDWLSSNSDHMDTPLGSDGDETNGVRFSVEKATSTTHNYNDSTNTKLHLTGGTGVRRNLQTNHKHIRQAIFSKLQPQQRPRILL